MYDPIESGPKIELSSPINIKPGGRPKSQDSAKILINPYEIEKL